MSNTDNLAARIETLRKVGKSTEADKIEKRLSELLEEANKIPTNLVIEIDMGPDHKFAGQGFHRENPRRFIGKTKFEIKPVVKAGQPAIKGDKMIQVAGDSNCDTTLEEGERIATFFNSPAGREAYKSLRAAGFLYLVLPHTDGVWVGDSCDYRYVPILFFHDGQCVSNLEYLENDVASYGGLLIPCKP